MSIIRKNKEDGNMEWTITLHNDEHYAEIITSGTASKDNSFEMAKGIVPILMRNEINKVLVDHRKIEKVSGELSEVYNRPKEFVNIGVARSVKIAEIIRPEHMAFFKFFELVLRNRGYNVSLFHDKESALEWLQIGRAHV